nr:MAG TPA: hypothetical protein [Caudoviricetes sp.]
MKLTIVFRALVGDSGELFAKTLIVGFRNQIKHNLVLHRSIFVIAIPHNILEAMKSCFAILLIVVKASETTVDPDENLTNCAPEKIFVARFAIECDNGLATNHVSVNRELFEAILRSVEVILLNCIGEFLKCVFLSSSHC